MVFLLEIPDKTRPSAQGENQKETPKQEDDQGWTLYTDRASIKEGSGAGLILTSPDGEEVTYTLRFDFMTYNKEAEYEALLAGL